VKSSHDAIDFDTKGSVGIDAARHANALGVGQ
jgi:hypothetical protein